MRDRKELRNDVKNGVDLYVLYLLTEFVFLILWISQKKKGFRFVQKRKTKFMDAVNFDMRKDLKMDKFFIDSYFKDLKERFDFLLELEQNGHIREAILLCCCYIESLGNMRYWQESRDNNLNFVRALINFGSNKYPWDHIHLKQIERHFNFLGCRKEVYKNIAEKIKRVLNDSRIELYTKEDVIDLSLNVLDEEEQQNFEERLWGCTLASIAYEELRCNQVHRLSSSVNISFSSTTFQERPLPEMSFKLLYDELNTIFDKIKNSGKWFEYNLSVSEDK
jgi:hypothetical protein